MDVQALCEFRRRKFVLFCLCHDLVEEKLKIGLISCHFHLSQVLAVKVLDKSAPQVQSEQDFLKLVSNIAHIQHANITELVGYCVEHGQRLLVYKYVSNGTLHEALHCHETTATKKHLSWSARAKIALGVARALE